MTALWYILAALAEIAGCFAFGIGAAKDLE